MLRFIIKLIKIIQEHIRIDEKERMAVSRFVLQCVSCVAFFCFVLLIGVGIANYGLKSMKGYRQPTYEQIAHMTGTENGNVEMEILGGSFSASEKQKQLENLRSFNVMEGLGRAMTVCVQHITRFSTDLVVGKIKEIFS